jgi:hypothetical protein
MIRDRRLTAVIAWTVPQPCAEHRCDPDQRRRIDMSIKIKALVAAAAVAAAGGVSVAGTISANAATPQCGPKCVEVFSLRFGTPARPNFVETVRHGIARVGQPTILYQASSSNPAEDLMPLAGTVADFYAAGLVSGAVNGHYGTLKALQLEYAPSGKLSGLCVGLAKPAFDNEALSLQSCSVPATTVFIIDTAVAPASANGYFAILNASTTDFSHPFGMTYTHEPPARIRVDHLDLSNGGTVPDSQLWSARFGALG